MGNRVLEQKRLKIKRRNRYVRLSGGDSKVAFGKVSLSKQVINTGHRPDINHKKLVLLNQQDRGKDHKWDYIPRTLGLSMEREHAGKLATVFKNWDRDLVLNHRVIDGRKVKIFCIYDRLLSDIYLVEIDYRRQTVRRSCNYQTIAAAQDAAILGKALWLKYTVERSSGS